MTFEEYHDLINRIEELERNQLGNDVIFIPLCILALVLVVFAIYFICIFIDRYKSK